MKEPLDDLADGIRILGENWCPAFLTNQSKCVHLFFNVVPKTTKEVLEQQLENAWNESPDVTLRIIFNLGNVRKDGAGKQDRTNFYRSILWLWRKDEESVIRNAALIHRHASLKCLLNLYMYIVHIDEDNIYNYEVQLKNAENQKQGRLKKRQERLFL